MIERLPRAVGAHLVGHDVGERVVDRVDQRVHGRIVGVDRRGKARIEHAAFARRDGEGAQQALADEDVRIDQRDQAIGAGRLHQRRADVGRPLGLVGGAGEIEMDACRPSCRRRRGCAPAFRGRCRRRRRSARPRSGRPSIRRRSCAACASDSSNRRSKQARIFSLPYLAASSLSAPLAEPVGAELAADVAEHEFGRAAVGADDALDVAMRLEAALIAHRRQVQALVEDLARLARSSFPAPGRRCRSCARSSRRSRTARRRRTPA